MFKSNTADKFYSNKGNEPLLEMIDSNVETVLDVGCGAGDNAKWLRDAGRKKIYGLTISRSEYEQAALYMEQCWLEDIEISELSCLNNLKFDLILFSHVLEHLREPCEVIARFVPYLRKKGTMLIAVPNVLFWRHRMDFILGKFEYQQAGTMDNTHLRFYTYFTADECLLSKSPHMKLICKRVEGSVPLWGLRRYILPRQVCHLIDDWGGKIMPNLFGGQVLIKAQRID